MQDFLDLFSQFNNATTTTTAPSPPVSVSSEAAPSSSITNASAASHPSKWMIQGRLVRDAQHVALAKQFTGKDSLSPVPRSTPTSVSTSPALIDHGLFAPMNLDASTFDLSSSPISADTNARDQALSDERRAPVDRSRPAEGGAERRPLSTHAWGIRQGPNDPSSTVNNAEDAPGATTATKRRPWRQPARSCELCRLKKTKCDRKRQCGSCTLRGTACEWSGVAKPLAEDPTSPSSQDANPSSGRSSQSSTRPRSVSFNSKLSMITGSDPSSAQVEIHRLRLIIVSLAAQLSLPSEPLLNPPFPTSTSMESSASPPPLSSASSSASDTQNMIEWDLNLPPPPLRLPAASTSFSGGPSFVESTSKSSFRSQPVGVQGFSSSQTKNGDRMRQDWLNPSSWLGSTPSTLIGSHRSSETVDRRRW